MTCMNRFSRTSSPATELRPDPPIYPRRAVARRAVIPTRSAKPRANTRQPVQFSPRAARCRESGHARPTAKVLPCRHQPAKLLCGMWRRETHGHEVGSAPRSVLLLDALTHFRPFVLSRLYPHRGQRAGGPVLSTPPPQTNSTTNQYQTGQSETNARLGGPPALRTKLYAQCERAGPGGSVELSQAGERDKRERKDPPGQAVPVPVPRPKGRRPRLRRFYSRMVEKIYREVVVAQGRQDKERHDNHHTYLPTHGQQPT